jgi:subtilase family serine protease
MRVSLGRRARAVLLVTALTAAAGLAAELPAAAHPAAAHAAGGLPAGAQRSGAQPDAGGFDPAAAGLQHACAWPPPAGQASCMLMFATKDRSPTPRLGPAAVPAATAGTYDPFDLQDAYGLGAAAANGGVGQTVAIVDAYDDPNAESDLEVYRDTFALPSCTTANGCFKKVNQKGEQSNYPAPNGGWASEISLDLDMVSAICPNCHILLVEASTPSTKNLTTAVNTAVRLGARYVSNSYGDPEAKSDLSYLSAYSHLGVAITVSAGDGGYQVDFPASAPDVTAVGGTSLEPASNSRGWAEIVWGGTGSGCSKYEAKPSWQRDQCPNRMVGDVAAVADPVTGVTIYDTYDVTAAGLLQPGWQDNIGGTSVASPIIAAVYALAGPPDLNSYPSSYPYANPGDLNDIVAGTNYQAGSCTPAYYCNGEPGYDGPTGFGTPEGTGAFAP